VNRSESLSTESRSIQGSPSYRLTKSRSESDLSQPESDEEGYSLSGRRNVDLDLAFTHKKRTPQTLLIGSVGVRGGTGSTALLSPTRSRIWT
uniref:Uncharacterized protein n=1 Tax=Astyanax mexicanus TaxID=7994 RepID=A0A8B9J5Y6_ASTMX